MVTPQATSLLSRTRLREIDKENMIKENQSMFVSLLKKEHKARHSLISALQGWLPTLLVAEDVLCFCRLGKLFFAILFDIAEHRNQAIQTIKEKQISATGCAYDESKSCLHR